MFLNSLEKTISYIVLFTVLCSNCIKYTKMNVYYTLDGAGKVNESRIEIKEHKKFLWVKQEKTIYQKDSSHVESSIMGFKKYWQSKGVSTIYVENLKNLE